MLFKCVKNLIIDSNSFSNSIKQQYQRIFFKDNGSITIDR